MDYSDSATPDVSYVYNRDGRRQQVTDGSGVRTISYDALGQVATESYTSGPLAGLSLNRGTDPLLRKTSLTLDKGGTTLWSQGFGYGDASRLASVTMGDDAVQYGYVPNSPLVGSVAFAHSGSAVMTTTKQYDAVNRLTQTSSAVGSTVVSSHQNSEINTLNQRRRTNLADGKYWKYGYNGRGELIRGTLYNASNQVVNGMDFQYTYDSSGNRLTHTVTGGATTVTTYTSNLVNQYTNIAAGATATPSYDADGNMTSSGSAYDDRILEYDGENRLTTVRRASDQAVVATYTYDDQGRRVRVQTTSAAPQGAGDMVNVWDGWNLVGELDYTVATGTHQPRRTYAWGLDLSGSEQGAGGIGGLVIQRDAASGDAYFPTYDPNGNLTTLVKSSDGTVGARYSYDPYGNLLSISSDPYSATNRFRFSTKYFCPETELYYYGYRYYNPVMGRWVNRDPIEEEGGANLFGMVNNDLVNRIDYLGLKDWKQCVELLKELARLSGNLVHEMSKYDPIADGLGGHPYKYGTTKPGGHYQEITDLQKALKKRLTKFVKDCIDDDDDKPSSVSWPSMADRISNLPIPQPVIPMGFEAELGNYVTPNQAYEIMAFRQQLQSIIDNANGDQTRTKIDKYSNEQVQKIVGAAIEVGGTAAGCYVTYRIIRFLPSLAPPLWWTMPANAAIP